MKVELKQIINQLSEAIGFEQSRKVVAYIDENTDEIVGWGICNVADDGTITPLKCNEPENGNYYKNIKELIENNKK